MWCLTWIFTKHLCNVVGFVMPWFIWAAAWQNQQNDCALSEDSDQPGHPPSLITAVCCVLNVSLRTQAFFIRTAKTLIRLGGCPDWSEYSLGTHAILLVLSWGGSFSFAMLWIMSIDRVSMSKKCSHLAQSIDTLSPCLAGWTAQVHYIVLVQHVSLLDVGFPLQLLKSKHRLFLAPRITFVYTQT